MEEKIVKVLNEMTEYLSVSQMKKLQEVILRTFAENEADKTEISNEEFLKMFLDAKKVEGWYYWLHRYGWSALCNTFREPSVV